MPAWSGTWKGGRYYLNEQGKPVYFIERRKRAVRLLTHDEDIAIAQLGQFLEDPAAFSARPPERVGPEDPVYVTETRVQLYLDSIRKCVEDHRTARKKYLDAWALKGLDLRTVDRKALRVALSEFGGGHKGRTEALNAFCRFLVKEGDLPAWNPLVCTTDAEATRAERVAYSVEELEQAYAKIEDQPIRDVFRLRAATGLHQTEIDQLAGARECTGPLPEKGAWIRTLGAEHEIRGVLQVMHKSRHRHRVSVDAEGLAAALRLAAKPGVPHRVMVWKALEPGIIPSNLRHTFVTLAGELGELVTYVTAGVDRARIAQQVGHRAGSTMTADRYDKLQVPPMIRLPFKF